MKTLAKMIGLAFAAPLIVTCGTEIETNITTAETSTQNASSKAYIHNEYVKPGASVTMTHNFKGFVQPGSAGRVNVTFTPAADAGTMTVNAFTKEGLALNKGSMRQDFKLGSSNDYAMDIGFTTQAPGMQYINFQVFTTDSAGQTLGRAFSVPIQVGDPALNPPAKPSANVETTATGQRIVVMDAEETIQKAE